MTKVLVSWIGAVDLKSPSSSQAGPILSTLRSESFDSVELLYQYPREEVERYLDWLKGQVSLPVFSSSVGLCSPVDFEEIYLAANSHLERITAQNTGLSILLTPGTPAMQSIWILLGKTRYPCTFYQSSLEKGVEQVTIPFDLSAEYIPAAKKLKTSKIHEFTSTAPPIDAAFDHIVTRNPQMLELKRQAHVLSQHDVPVLILGESGTGKELFARAIHNASSRSGQPFVPLNCGAIPPELVDSELFGHKKGAFTGAIADRPGVFEQANGGTLFLDEFGELSPAAQVRLLRVLQDGVYMRVGDTQSRNSNVRILCATNRDLLQGIQNGAFREDLLYRVAVGVLKLPSLRDRDGDLMLLVKSLLEGLAQTGLDSKKISAGAKKIILNHRWPGNIRELRSTIQRSLLWASGKIITEDDMQMALLSLGESRRQDLIFNRELGDGFDIEEVLGEVAAHYIAKALEESGGQKTKAAELLGFKNHQTFGNWQKKYGSTL